jgi:hypothetical protein
MSAIDELLAARQTQKAKRIADLMWIDRWVALGVWSVLQMPRINQRRKP